MADMRRIPMALLASLVLALVLPAAAPATLSEVGLIGATSPATVPSCASSPPVKLQPYFGKTAQFPLETTLKVKKGDVVALSVPTWAPALALGFGNDTSWRASRARSQCTSTSAQSTQTLAGTAVQYYCLYQTARLTYTA